MANFAIMGMQICVGLLAGSVGMISDGVHTATDLLSAIAAFFSIRISARPADKCHPWGHGKYENLAALGQGGLILISAATIGWEAVDRLRAPVPLAIMELGMLITAICIVIQVCVSWMLLRTGKKTESPALAGVALHMLTDVGSSVAVLIGLSVTRFWGIMRADAVAALTVAVLVGISGIRLLHSASRDLVDSSLPQAEREAVEGILNKHMPPLRGFHKVRTRRVGRFKYLEAHLLVDGALSVEQAHDLCDHLEEHLRDSIPCSSSLLHVEPDKYW